MGNTGSSSANAKSLHTAGSQQHALSLVAVANAMTLTQQQVIDLRKNCAIGSLGQKRTRSKLSRASFQIAMCRAKISQTHNDWDIIEQLFTLWDEEGEERLDFREFLAGISPLACGGKTLPEVLSFAMKVSDVQHAKHISRADLEMVLSGINATASYFGDRVLSKEQVEKIADSVFLSLQNDHNNTAYWSHNTGDLSHKACAKMLSTHPVVEQFLLGLGQYKYFPVDHSMHKDEGPHHEGLIVGKVRNADGIILSTEIGAYRRHDEINEI